jgi:hypothetical protein
VNQLPTRSFVAAALTIAATCAACKRTPLPGQAGTVVAAGSPAPSSGPALSSEPPAPYRVASYPGGGVFVGDVATCSASMLTAASGTRWTRALPRCDGVLEIAVAADSTAYARTGTGLVAFTPEGVERWRNAVGTEPVPRAILAPVTTADSLVVVAANPRLVLGFKGDGKEAFRFSPNAPERIVAPLARGLTEGVVLVTDAAVYLVGTDGTTHMRVAPVPVRKL